MSQKLKFGSGTWATKEGSTLAYNDENNNFKPLPFNFERDSIATRVNKEGLIEVVGKDIPRIDYKDSAEGVLFLEKAATNLVTHSEDFSNNSWTKLNSLITSNVAISPDGTLNADKLIPDTVNTQNHYIRDTISIANLTDYSFSFFAKKGEYNFVSTYISALGGSYTWDLDNGVVVLGDAFIENYGNGWYRCGINATSSSTSLSYRIYVSKYSDRDTLFQGDGTSGIYIWGAQLEQNSVASSYIPTNGSAVPRAAETCNGAGNEQVFNDSEGVLFADIAALADDSTNRQITLSDGTDANRLVLKYDNQSNIIQVFNRVNGSETAFLNASVSDITLFNKCLLKYKVNDYALWINGFKVDTDTSSTIFPSNTLDDLKFGEGSVSDFYGKTKEIGYYDTALTDEELEYMTSYRSLNELVTELNLNEL